jgi:autotransporter passenger strand-loop-strand repeat protein
MNTYDVYSGESVSGNVLGPGDTLTVYAGGTAAATTVGDGAAIYVEGGTASTTLLQSGGTVFVQSGSDIGTVVSGGGSELVYNTGSAIGTQVRSGGLLNDAAVTNEAVVSNGGTEIVFNGATAISTEVLPGGVLIVAPGATVSGATGSGAVASSGVVALQPGLATILDPVSGLALGAGAAEYVLTSGLAKGTVLNGAEQYLMAGVASATVVNSGGTQFVSAGAAYDTVVNSGGTQIVEAAYPLGGGAGTAYGTTIAAGGTLDLAFGGTLSGGVQFSGAGGMLYVSAALPSTPITGFAAGDVIDLAQMKFVSGASASLSGGVLSITDGGTAGSLTLTGDAGAVFEVTADAAGGTDITAAPLCFCVGTRIATPAGDLPVEALQIGDLVLTLHGGTRAVKWLGRRSYDAAFLTEHADMRPIRITRDAIEEGVPARDLLVSSGHGICLDGGLVPAFRLVNGVTILREAAREPVLYIHVELDEHEILFAEGCPAESFFENDFRGYFDNADEYQTLYPYPSAGAPVMCLPRLEDGFVLQAIQRRLAERAGLPPVEASNGPLRGFVDQAGPEIVSGWAQCESQPEEPVCLDIWVGGKRVLRALANRYREDLHQAGLGSGNHSFKVQLPAETHGTVEVRRTYDQTPLPLTDAAVRVG